MAKYVSIGQLQGEIRKSFASLKKYMDESIRAPVVSIAQQAKALADEVVRRANAGEFKGEKGDTGEKGEKGDTALDFAIGSVTDGETISVTDVGSGGHVVLDFVLRAGRDGQDGAPGRDGAPGQDGAPGRDGAPGQDGADGKSAYASAQDGGYSGTEAQFNADLAAVGERVNPNLLDNWYFGNPVNQRGQTTYSTGEGGAYTIDRWKIGWNASVVIHSAYLSVNAFEFWQPIEEKLMDALIGKTVTASVLFADGVLSRGSALISGAEEQVMPGSITVYNHSTRYGTSVRISPTGNIVAAKLELGSQQTLAHKENGVWVLNELPDYGEQLRRCMRYFVKLNSDTKAHRFDQLSSNQAEASLSLPVPMRITPAIVDSSALTVKTVSGESAQSGFSFGVSGGTDGSLRLIATKASHGLTDGCICETALELTADL